MCHHFTTEVVGRGETCVVAAEGWICGVPFTFLAFGGGHIDGCHHHESRIDSHAIFTFDGCIAFHVGLSETEVDVKVGVESLRLFDFASVDDFCFASCNVFEEIDALCQFLDGSLLVGICFRIFVGIGVKCLL